MKRALTFLFAVVSCWTVSFVQAANVGLNFYSGTPGVSVSVAEDLHYAVIGIDGAELAKESLVAENKGKAEAELEANSFYVIVEQDSTKYFGSVLVKNVPENDDLFFVLDATGLNWLEGAHRCPDDAECMQDGRDCVADCCGDDCCDADCICRKLSDYVKNNGNVDEADIVDDGVVDSSEGASANGQTATSGKTTANGQTATSGKTAANGQTTMNGQSALQTRSGQSSSSRVSTNSSTLSSSPYSSGVSNFGSTGVGPSPYGRGFGGGMGAAGGMSSLGMLGMIGAMIAVSVTRNSTSPSGTSAESK